MNDGRFPTTYTRLLARALGLKHGEMVPLLVGTGLTPEDVEFERRNMSPGEQYQVIENGLALSAEPGLGLKVGEITDLSTHGILGIAALTSATLMDVLKILGKYYLLRAPICEIQLKRTNDRVILRIKNVDEISREADIFLIEAYMAMVQTVAESIIGRTITEATLVLPFESPEHAGIYSHFFHGPVGFNNQEFAEYTIPANLADRPCPTGDAQLHRQAELGCKELLARIQCHETFTAKLEHIFSMEDGTLLTLEESATLLNVSARTLIRKLKQEGTTYQTLVDERHKALCAYYFADPRMSVEAIGLALGYTYAANFRRAFRRWFGMSPSEYRDQLRGDAL